MQSNEMFDRAAAAVRSRAPLLLAAALAFVGIVLCGQGLWIHAKAVLAQVLLEHAFAQTLVTGKPVKPWSWADTWPEARIEVPRLGKSAIVLHGSSGQALAFDAASGRARHGGLLGHRDTHFGFLADVVIGDEVRVTRQDGAVFRFRVTATAVVRWDHSGIDPFAPGRRMVLATCWPLDGTFASPLRYLVQAEMIGTATLDSARD